MGAQSLSHVCQAPLSMEFFRQEYGSGLPFPPAGGLPDPGIKPESLVSPSLQADSFFKKVFLLTFNGLMIALQYWFHFCHSST